MKKILASRGIILLLIVLVIGQSARIPQIKASSSGMDQVFFGGWYDRLDETQTEYNTIVGGFAWRVPETDRAVIVSTDGIFKQLRVKLDGFPGVGAHYDFTLMLNGVPTALTFGIADLETSGSNMINEITVSGGDSVSLQQDPDNTPIRVHATWSIVFESDNPFESLIMGGSDDQLNNAGIEYSTVMHSRVFYAPFEVNYRQVVPTTGRIKDLYVWLSEDPGNAPDAYRFTVRKGGASQALTVTINADDSTGSDLINSFEVIAGDVLTFMIEPLNGPATTPKANWGMTFEADVNGESILLGGSYQDLDRDAIEYNHLVHDPFNQWIPLENQRYLLGQVCILKDLYVLLSVAPTPGESFQFTLRVNGGDTDLGVEIADLETTGHSAVSERIDIANDDYANLKVDPFGTPLVGDAFWGIVVYTGPAIESPYTPKIDPFSIGADGVWTDYDLFTNQEVPKGAIVEIVFANNNTGFARVAGVRTDGSSLNRYIDLHEAEGGGITTGNMFVKSNETNGLIEVYAEVGVDVEFYLLGYFSSSFDFTEAFEYMGYNTIALWFDKDLSGYGVPNNAVSQILITNSVTDGGFGAGVREDGSVLNRLVILDEAEPDGYNCISMVVKANGSSVIEWRGFRQGVPPFGGIQMWVLGWFSSNVNFTEGWTDYSPALDNTWTMKTIAEANASSVISFALVHEDSGAETFGGLREAGSGRERRIEEHEAEGGDSTGFQASVLIGPDKKLEVYCEDASEAQFFYSGFFSTLAVTDAEEWGLLWFLLILICVPITLVLVKGTKR